MAVIGEIVTHFHLDTQMSSPAGLRKDITQFGVAENHITTPFAGNSMMAKWIQGNLRAQWAARTIGKVQAKPALDSNLKLERVKMKSMQDPLKE